MMTAPLPATTPFSERVCTACNSPFSPEQLYCSRCGSILPHVLAMETWRERDKEREKSKVVPNTPNTPSSKATEPMTAQFLHNEQSEASHANGTTYFHPRAQLYFETQNDEMILPVQVGAEPVLLGRRAEGISTSKLLDLALLNAQALGVSRNHAHLERLDNVLYITDLGSANGTFINMRRIPIGVRTPLSNRAILSLGKLVLRVRFA